MENAVVETRGNLPAPAPRRQTPQVEATDISIPVIQLVQAMSEAAQKGLAGPGHMVRSTDKHILAKPDQKIEIIPLTFFKNWIVKRKKNANDSKGEYIRTDPYNFGDQSLPFNWTEEGQHYFRDLYFNLFCLLASDIAKRAEVMKVFKETGEMPDIGASILPAMIRFKRTSYNAAKIIATHFAQCEDISQECGRPFPVYSYVFELGQEQVVKDNTYNVFTTARTRKTTDEEKETALRWINTLATANVEVDQSDIVEETGASQDAAAHPAGTREF